MSFPTPYRSDDQPLTLVSLHNEVVHVKNAIVALRTDLLQLGHQAQRLTNSPDNNQTRWLSVQDAACIARRTACTIRRWIKDGRLPAKKPAGSGKKGQWRISEADLQSFLYTSAS